mgnify:CR=1 FL=1
MVSTSAAEEPPRKEANILLIGDGAVGKTSIVQVYSGRGFSEAHMATLGLDYINQDVSPSSNPSDGYKLRVWDTAGQERFKSLTLTFYKQSQGMIVCFDLTRRTSFDAVSKWMANIGQNCESGVPCILVGNKGDLEEERVVSKEEAESLS